jgi:zinc protease
VLLGSVLLCLSAARAAEAPWQQTTLANGLDVIVLEAHATPLVTVEIAVKNGAYTEPPDYNGLSHVYEHMFFKANQKIPNQERFHERERELGIVSNGSTGTERVNYFVTTTKGFLREAMVFMNDAIRYPLFDETELAKERQVILGEFDRADANPYDVFDRRVDEKLWYRYPGRKDPLGRREVIAATTPEQMRTVQRKFYVPNNSALFVTGDVQAAEIFPLAQDIFGDWERGANPFDNPTTLVEHPPLERSVALILEQPVQVPVLMLTWQGPDTRRDAPATYAADVFSYILGQPNSYFQQTLVHSGLMLQASLGYLTQMNAGQITLFGYVQPEKFREALGAIYAEIDRFDDPDYFPDEQLANAKTLLEIQDLYSREEMTEMTHTLSFWWASAGLDYYRDYFDHLRQVTREDTAAYVRRYLQGQPFVCGVCLSPETQQELKLTEEEVLP